MKFLPYQRWSLEVPVDGAILTERLHASIEPSKWLRWGRDHKPMQGTG
jgi:hypothetical protein